MEILTDQRHFRLMAQVFSHENMDLLFRYI